MTLQRTRCAARKSKSRRDAGATKALRLLGRGVARGCVGVDIGAVYHQVYAAISLAAFGRVVSGDGLGFAEAALSDGGGGDALIDQEIADHAGAALGKLLIKFVGADAVGVSFDLHAEAGVRKKDAGNFASFSRAPGFSV